MSPTFSLIVLCLAEAILTAVKWSNRAVNFTDRTALGRKIGWHLLASLIVAGGVWLVNCFWWAKLSDQGAILLLLLVEGFVVGGISASILFSQAWIHIPANEVNDEAKKGLDTGGVVRLNNLKPTRGILGAGSRLVWNEKLGCWTNPEGSREDNQRNSLAS